jgi:hypothetical protein
MDANPLKDFLENEGVKSCSIVDEFPEKILVLKNGTRMVCLYVPERTAKRVCIPRQNHVALGHIECGECGTHVGPQDRYRRRCGARLGDG